MFGRARNSSVISSFHKLAKVWPGLNVANSIVAGEATVGDVTKSWVTLNSLPAELKVASQVISTLKIFVGISNGTIIASQFSIFA